MAASCFVWALGCARQAAECEDVGRPGRQRRLIQAVYVQVQLVHQQRQQAQLPAGHTHSFITSSHQLQAPAAVQCSRSTRRQLLPLISRTNPRSTPPPSTVTDGQLSRAAHLCLQQCGRFNNHLPGVQFSKRPLHPRRLQRHRLAKRLLPVSKCLI